MLGVGVANKESEWVTKTESLASELSIPLHLLLPFLEDMREEVLFMPHGEVCIYRNIIRVLQMDP